MKYKVVCVTLSILAIIIISFLIIFNIYLNYIDKISKTIDNDIIVEKEYNEKLTNKLDEIKIKNNIQEKNLKNMNDYINLLNERIKEYE